MQLNLHLLRLFVAVAEAGSFSRAAEALWISQPAVSKGISELEHQLDLALLERGQGGSRGGAKGIHLTEAGTALLSHARAIFAIERTALEDVRARVGVQRGSLSVGASTTVASYWLPPFIARFHAQHPFVAPKLVVGNTQWICEQLAQRSIDLALVEGEVDDDRFDTAFWRDDPLALVVPPGPAAGLQAVLGAGRWILREPGSGTRQAAEAVLHRLGHPAAPWMEMASNEAIARTVASGLGASILPRAVVADLLQLGALQELALQGAEDLSRPLYRVTLKGRPLSPAAAGMLALLEA